VDASEIELNVISCVNFKASGVQQSYLQQNIQVTHKFTAVTFTIVGYLETKFCYEVILTNVEKIKLILFIYIYIYIYISRGGHELESLMLYSHKISNK
jgi:hypothetical protein